MSARCAAPTPKNSYFVLCVSYPRREVDGVIFPAGREAIVDPETTRRDILDQVREITAKGREIAFIHEITDAGYSDVTEQLLYEATLESVDEIMGSDRQAQAFDHKQDHRKHGEFV